MDFKFKHIGTGEIRTLSLTENEMANLIYIDVLFDEFCKEQCKCQPVGETYVVDCECGDYFSDFELQQ